MPPRGRPAPQSTDSRVARAGASTHRSRRPDKSECFLSLPRSIVLEWTESSAAPPLATEPHARAERKAYCSIGGCNMHDRWEKILAVIFAVVIFGGGLAGCLHEIGAFDSHTRTVSSSTTTTTSPKIPLTLAKVQKAENAMVAALWRCEEAINDLCRDWYLDWAGQIETAAPPFSETLFNYFDPNSDWIEYTWHGREGKFYEFYWETSRYFTVEDGNVVIRWLGTVTKSGGWEDRSDQREVLENHVGQLRGVLSSIREDLELIVLNEEFGTREGDRPIVKDWLITDRMIEEAIRDLELTVHSQLRVIGALAEPNR